MHQKSNLFLRVNFVERLKKSLWSQICGCVDKFSFPYQVLTKIPFLSLFLVNALSFETLLTKMLLP
jgi:hypothetical protein